MGISVYLSAFSNAFTILATYFYWALIILLFSFVLRSAWFKGMVGEWFVNFIINFNFKEPSYFLFKNVLLQTQDGTTQLDHILVSRYGIFVIETKNMKGWIFGSEKQAKWTQQIYKHKSSFQNPLRQNFKHTAVLSSLLGISHSKVNSIVVFIGGASFKTKMPSNVIFSGNLKAYIKSFSQPIFSDDDLLEIKNNLANGKLASSFKNNRQHVKHVKELQKGKETTPSFQPPKSVQELPVIKPIQAIVPEPRAEALNCPKCGNTLKMRIAARGEFKGSKFYGCGSFPKCRYTRKVN